MMGLEVIWAVTEPTPISITFQARLADVLPGDRRVIGIGVGHGQTSYQSEAKRTGAWRSMTKQN
jgi:hypothetical protein